MKRRLALLVSCWCWGFPANPALAADVEAAHPLLDLARELEASRKPVSIFDHDAPDLRSARHALEQARPPDDQDCARSLGAAVYSDLHAEVAQASAAIGDFHAASRAYLRALACTPRNTRVLNNLANALFNARDLRGAREYVQRALSIDPKAVYLSRLAASIDFVEERWADAVSRYRYAAASEPDRVRAAYSQLMYWLAQWRAGVRQPEFVARRHTDGWPRPLLLYLQDQYTEAELVEEVREGDNEYASVGRDVRLCEALFYVGEAHWARGHAALAREYFAAAVNIKMLRLEEHVLALAEIAKLQTSPGEQRPR